MIVLRLTAELPELSVNRSPIRFILIVSLSTQIEKYKIYDTLIIYRNKIYYTIERYNAKVFILRTDKQ